MDSLLRYAPRSVIQFSVNPGFKATTTLLLTNISDAPVAYKVKTTNVKRYCVYPTADIIELGQTLEVTLSQLASAKPPEDLNDCRDRFMLLAVKLNDSLPELVGEKKTQNVWEKVPAEAVVKVRFTVQLKLRDGDGIVTEAVKDSAAVAPATAPPLQLSLTPLEPMPVAESSPTQSSEQNESHLSAAKPPIPPTDGRRWQPASTKQTTLDASLPSPTTQTVASQTVTSAPLTLSRSPDSPQPPSHPSPVTLQSKTKPVPRAASAVPSVHVQTTAESITKSTPDSNPDYTSIEWARERALGVRTAPKVSPPALDRATRQRVAVERAGELVRVINSRQNEIDAVSKELAEARHKLSDAQMATRPAYDVRYEVNESARVPFAQICIMAIISGALLQLLV